MPIRPPNLDDRRYDDILREARALIPQYAPEWTNLSDADPGMTLVQLFAWMTEMIIFRLNQVPDKTYIHFLNFIGEERRAARPASAPLTFTSKVDRPVDIPAFTRCATRQREDSTAADFVTVEPLTVHGASLYRLLAVRGGKAPAVREIPFSWMQDNASAVTFTGGRGVDLFDLDPVEFGPDAWTPLQHVYLAHDDFRLMGTVTDPREAGRLRIRRAGGDSGDRLSIAALFAWEYLATGGWTPVPEELEPETRLGMPEVALTASLPGLSPLTLLPIGEETIPLPKPVVDARWWLRGRLEYERWLAERMRDDLDIGWRDDRGGEERALHNWEVRASGRTLEFFLQDLPPVRGGWTIRFALTDRRLPATAKNYLPRYRWSYRRGEGWEEIPADRIRVAGLTVTLTGPLTDMATDGYNLRAERIETVNLEAFLPDLEVEVEWVRPIELMLFAGDDARRLEELLVDESPWSPFQIAAMVPPTLGRRWYVGSDLFENRRQAPVTIEIDVAFEMNGMPIAEPVDSYALQLLYRAADGWRAVKPIDPARHPESPGFRFTSTGFTFAEIDRDTGRGDTTKTAGKRSIRFTIDPARQLEGLSRHLVGGKESTWIRFDLVKASLTGADEKKQQFPIIPRMYGIRLGVEGSVDAETWEQPIPDVRVARVDGRPQNRRLTRVTTRALGKTQVFQPFDAFVEIDTPNQALYLQMDQALPAGRHHTIHFRTRGETFLPPGVTVEWEVLEDRGHGRTSWRRLFAPSGDEPAAYALAGSGTLRFSLPEGHKSPADGFWLRARFTGTAKAHPTTPPLTHLFLNTVDVVNLITVRTERFSGLGVPSQALQLRRFPVFLHEEEKERSPFADPTQFTDMRVLVEDEDGSLHEWQRVSDSDLLVAGKDDRVYVVDAVDGTLTFGNGIRGRMLPAGSSNLVVDTYRLVPGAKGNVGPQQITLVEGFADVAKCENLLPASGGRDAESIEDILRRAPSLLTSRDRAVTRSDFATIATEASGEVARAACDGRVGSDGTVSVTILPRRREGESVPDPMLSTGLRDHVQRYLKRRCLINLTPKVQLARFMPIDVSVTLRLRPNANLLAVREAAGRWVARFLDPYEGGIDNTGWPFGGVVYAQDFARMVGDLPEVRHVVDVHLYDVGGERAKRPAPGWEAGEGSREIGPGDEDLFELRLVRVRVEGAEE